MFIVYESGDGVMLDARFPDQVSDGDGQVAYGAEALRLLVERGHLPDTRNMAILPSVAVAALAEHAGKVVPADGLIEVMSWEPFKYRLSLDGVKARAKEQVITFADQVGTKLTAGYPKAEVQSWPAKAAEAKAWLADTTQPAPAIIDAEAQATGQTPQQVAQAVVAKAAFFEQVAGLIAGLRQKTEAAIDAATDAAAVEAAMQAGLAAAQTEMQKLGIAP